MTRAVLGAGNIACWGTGLPHDDGNYSFVSSTPVVVPGISNATAVSVGRFSDDVCALLATGRVMCWGRNKHGQLGNGTRTSSEIPVQVTGITNAVDVSVSQDQACALLADGTIACWETTPCGPARTMTA